MVEKLDREELFILHIQDQLEAWLRDNNDCLIDFFKNYKDTIRDYLILEDEELDEYMKDLCVPAAALLMNELIRYRDKSPFFDEDDIDKLSKFAKNATWKDIALLFLTFFTEDFVEIIDNIQSGNRIEDDEQTDLLNLIVLMSIVLRNEKTKKK